MVTMDDAKIAVKKIKACWLSYLPPDLLMSQAEQVFVFCNELEFKAQFTLAYERLFKKANDHTGTVDEFICGVGAFVSPHSHRHGRRKVYVNSEAAGLCEKILAHEYVHWLSHENFYPKFYAVGGDNPFRVEGITHWATCAAGYKLQENPAGYVTEVLQTVSWLEADEENEERMLAFLFEGEETDLCQLRK